MSEYSININTDRVYFAVCVYELLIGCDTRVLVPFVTHVGSNRLARGRVLTRTQVKCDPRVACGAAGLVFRSKG